MAKIWELLDQAHYFIGMKRYSEAQSILDQILYTDPQNVEAWDAYMRICTTRRDLEVLKHYIAKVWDARVRDQDYLHANERFILQRVDERISSM